MMQQEENLKLESHESLTCSVWGRQPGGPGPGDGFEKGLNMVHTNIYLTKFYTVIAAALIYS